MFDKLFGRKNGTDNKELILSTQTKVGPTGVLDGGNAFNCNVAALSDDYKLVQDHLFAPNILQANGSYIVCDIGGRLYEKFGVFLRGKGYDVKVMNFLDLEHSCHYNPFEYIHSEDDIADVVDIMLKSTKTTAEDDDVQDDYWGMIEKPLLCALIGYLRRYGSKEEQNISGILKLIRKVDGECEKNQTAFSYYPLFNQLVENDPESYVAKQYKLYCVTLGQCSSKSLSIDICIRLADCDREDLPKKAFAEDNLRLPEIMKKDSALFICLPEDSKTYMFMAAMLLHQIGREYCLYKEANPRTARHMSFLLDKTEEIEKAFYRYEEIFTQSRKKTETIIYHIHSIDNLRQEFPSDWDIILSDTDNIVYFGGWTGMETKEFILKFSDQEDNKEMISFVNSFMNVRWAKEQAGKCIVVQRRQPAVVNDVYREDSHPNYKDVSSIK